MLQSAIQPLVSTALLQRTMLRYSNIHWMMNTRLWNIVIMQLLSVMLRVSLSTFNS